MNLQIVHSEKYVQILSVNILFNSYFYGSVKHSLDPKPQLTDKEDGIQTKSTCFIWQEKGKQSEQVQRSINKTEKGALEYTRNNRYSLL